jgi:hypothetical protein
MGHLRAEEAVKPAEPEEDLAALRDLEAVAAMCGRVRKNLREGSYMRLREERRPQLVGAWQEVQLAFDALAGLLAEEGVGC